MLGVDREKILKELCVNVVAEGSMLSHNTHVLLPVSAPSNATSLISAFLSLGWAFSKAVVLTVMHLT